MKTLLPLTLALLVSATGCVHGAASAAPSGNATYREALQQHKQNTERQLRQLAQMPRRGFVGAR